MIRPSAACLIAALIGGVSHAQSARRLLPATWRETGRFEDVDAKFYANPIDLIACGDHLVVLDGSDPHVAAFDLNGKPLWRFGRAGSGPGELRRPASLSCDSNGRLWIYDAGNARVLVLTAQGSLERSIAIAKPAQHVVVTPDGVRLVATVSQRDALAEIRSLDGAVLVSIAAPADLVPLSVLQRETIITPTPDGDLIIGFHWSGILIRHSAHGAVVFRTDGLDRMNFPQQMREEFDGGYGIFIDSKAPQATRRVQVSDGVVSVLFDGGPPRRGSSALLIDQYDARDGRYLGSYRLPVGAEAFALRGKTVYALVSEPAPAIVRLQR